MVARVAALVRCDTRVSMWDHVGSCKPNHVGPRYVYTRLTMGPCGTIWSYVKRVFADRKLVKVYFDADQYVQIEARAHGNVSAYLRELAIQDLRNDAGIRVDERSAMSAGVAALREQIPELTTAAELPKRSVLDRLPVVGGQHVAKPGAKTCKHGTQKGYRCWQCGGLAHVGE